MSTTTLKIPTIEVHTCGLLEVVKKNVNEVTAILTSSSELHITIIHSDLKYLKTSGIDNVTSIISCAVGTHFRLCGAFAGQEDTPNTRKIIQGISRDIKNYFLQALNQFAKETNQLQLDIRMLVSKEDINLKKSYIDKSGNYSRPK